MLTLFSTHSIAHELTRLAHNFKRKGYLDTVGPAGGLSVGIAGLSGKLTNEDHQAPMV